MFEWISVVNDLIMPNIYVFHDPIDPATEINIFKDKLALFANIERKINDLLFALLFAFYIFIISVLTHVFIYHM